MADGSVAQFENGTRNYTSKPKSAKNGHFWTSNLEPSMRAIWGGPSVFDECASSFSSFSSSSTEPFQQSGNLEITEKSEMRQVTGRTSAYYLKFGADLWTMPTNGYTDTSLGTNQAVPFRTLTVGAVTLPPGYKANEQLRQRNGKSKVYAFCKNINSSAAGTHWLKSNQGVITCPLLRTYNCSFCKNGGGDKAHTLRFCPLRRLQLAEKYERVKVSPSKYQTSGLTSPGQTNINFTTQQQQ